MFPSHLCRFPLHSLCLSLPQCSNNKRQVSTVTSETRKYVINSNHHWILFRLFRHFVLFDAEYLPVHIAGFSYHSQSVSLPPQWKTYSQISPWIVFKSFTFSPLSQIVPVEVLRQVTSIMELFLWKQLKIISR